MTKWMIWVAAAVLGLISVTGQAASRPQPKLAQDESRWVVMSGPSAGRQVLLREADATRPDLLTRFEDLSPQQQLLSEAATTLLESRDRAAGRGGVWRPSMLAIQAQIALDQLAVAGRHTGEDEAALLATAASLTRQSMYTTDAAERTLSLDRAFRTTGQAFTRLR